MSTDPAPRTFDFAFAPSHRRAARLFGVTPDRAIVTVTDREFCVRYGPWFVATSRENIVDVRITGPYRWFKTAGPARLGITDRGLTFASNRERGVELHFREPIVGIEPTGRLRHPNLTLTVADCTALAELLAR
jgi:hypothetical protein